ncbi:MAG: ABC transporter substrate-binding protein [Fusobacterium mortiferum]|nr:ABC transporter substrate-binding protein [Fusobacterium mortiferum]
MKKIIVGIIVVFIAFIGFMYIKSSENQGAEVEKVVVEHSLGSVEVPKNPKRVVVFDYGILDILDTLGANVIGLPRDMVPEHLSKYSSDKYANLGSLKEPNLEKIYEVKPDLIIIAGRQRDFYSSLSKVAPTIFVETSSTDYMKGLKTNIDILTKVFDNSQMLNEKYTEIESRVNSIKAKVEEKGYNAMVLLSNNGRIAAYGEKSRFSIFYDYLGFKTTGEVVASTHGNKVTFEYLLEKNPDYIYIVDKAAVVGDNLLANKAFDNPIVKSTKAAQNGNIVFLNSVVWYTASGGLKSTEIMLDEVEKSIEK